MEFRLGGTFWFILIFQKKKRKRERMRGAFPVYTPPYQKKSKLRYPGSSGGVDRGGVRFQTITGVNERRSQRLSRAGRLAAVGGRPPSRVPVASRALDGDAEGEMQGQLRNMMEGHTREEVLRSSLRMEELMKQMIPKKAPVKALGTSANPLWDLPFQSPSTTDAPAGMFTRPEPAPTTQLAVHDDAAGTFYGRTMLELWEKSQPGIEFLVTHGSEGKAIVDYLRSGGSPEGGMKLVEEFGPGIMAKLFELTMMAGTPIGVSREESPNAMAMNVIANFFSDATAFARGPGSMFGELTAEDIRKKEEMIAKYEILQTQYRKTHPIWSHLNDAFLAMQKEYGTKK